MSGVISVLPNNLGKKKKKSLVLYLHLLCTYETISQCKSTCIYKKMGSSQVFPWICSVPRPLVCSPWREQLLLLLLLLLICPLGLNTEMHHFCVYRLLHVRQN